jgi:DNA-binding transcriptional LysR family regulator
VGTFKDDRLVALELGRFSRWLVATPEVDERFGPKSPSDLSNMPCLTFRGDRPGGTWQFTRGGIEETVDVSGPIAVRSFGILLQLVQAGQGFANLPEFLVKDQVRHKRLVRCLADYNPPSFPVFLTFRPGARNVARIAAVIEAAEESVSSMLLK